MNFMAKVQYILHHQSRLHTQKNYQSKNCETRAKKILRKGTDSRESGNKNKRTEKIAQKIIKLIKI